MNIKLRIGAKHNAQFCLFPVRSQCNGTFATSYRHSAPNFTPFTGPLQTFQPIRSITRSQCCLVCRAAQSEAAAWHHDSLHCDGELPHIHPNCRMRDNHIVPLQCAICFCNTFNTVPALTAWRRTGSRGRSHWTASLRYNWTRFTRRCTFTI